MTFYTSEMTHRETLWDVLLDETNISSISRAFSLLVHFVLIAACLGGGLGGCLCLGEGGVGLQVKFHRMR